MSSTSNEPMPRRAAPSAKPRFATYGFALACFCFLLPFLTVSCGGMSMTLSGFQTITGASTEELGEKAHSARSRVRGSVSTGLAAFCALIGLLLTLRPGSRLRQGLATGAAALGALSLVLFKASAELAATTQGMGLISLRFGFGYWLSLLSLVGALVALIAARRRRGAAETSPVATPALAAGSGDRP